VARCGEAICEVARATAKDPIAVIAGYVTAAEHGAGKHVMNSAALVRHGHVEFVQSKMLLPYYDVFDEQRYFAPAARQRICHLDGQPVALTICEDAWNDKSFWENRLYSVDPSRRPDEAGRVAHPQYLRVAVVARQARAAPGNAGGHRQAAPRAGGDGEPGGRRRQPGLRRIEPRDRAQTAR
jgi:predicted amidohydrolase